MPAWRFVDPLPILEQFDAGSRGRRRGTRDGASAGDDEGDDGESLESMVAGEAEGGDEPTGLKGATT
jgi:hypothetical protein